MLDKTSWLPYDLASEQCLLGAILMNNDALVAVQDMHLNSDYPKTTPRGGTGKARLLP